MAQNCFLFCRSSSPQEEKDKKVNGEPEEESCQQSFLSFLNLKPGKFKYFFYLHILHPVLISWSLGCIVLILMGPRMQ